MQMTSDEPASSAQGGDDGRPAYDYPTGPCVACEALGRLTDDATLVSSPFAAGIVWSGSGVEGSAAVVPRRHVMSMFELTDAELKDLASVTRATVRVIEERYAARGMSISWDAGVSAGQREPHLVIHVVPRKMQSDDER